MGSATGGDLVIALSELGGSGQSGIATLTAMGDQTKVKVSISAGAAGVLQPIHVHAGTCDTLGGVNFPLSSVDNGQSSSVIDASLASLMNGDSAINVHLSGDEIGTYVACGSIPASGASATIALGELGGSGQAGTATLIGSGGQTIVVVSVGPGAEGVAQPIHIHSGACDTLGGVEYPLTSAMNGVSMSVVDASMQSLMGGGFAINLHKSGDEISVYTACGNIQAG